MRKIGLSLLLASTFVAGVASAKSSDWRITQPAWTEYHEQQFGDFVAQIGRAVESRRCGTMAECLQSSANPYYSTDPAGINYFSDCADLPYYLRFYFAWKNGLPFSFATSLRENPVPVDPESTDSQSNDIRYSKNGNYAVNRWDMVARKGKFPNAVNILNQGLIDSISSGTFRMLGDTTQGTYTDFYPVKLQRGSVRPGTAIYDPNGHVAIIYKINEEGRIFYIDSHPDNSITSGLYTSKFMRSNPRQGAGFKNFRPLELVGATMDSSGAYVGGSIVAKTNLELPNYSLEQYYGNQPDSSGDWRQGQFVLNGQKVSYFDYVQLRLTNGELHIDPLLDMKLMVQDICVALKDRVAAVDAARTSGVYLKSHPDRLPDNIYGTSGEWEDYATSSRDARLKTSFVDLLTFAKKSMDQYRRGDRTLKYNGGNLAKDLFAVYAKEAMACKFSYVISNGQTLVMNLEAARQRLYSMSFDPYHCVELRWGARLPQELTACPDGSNKKQWYNQEQWLRNQTERRYDVKMNYSLDQLRGPMPGVGVANPPDVDIVGYLKGLM